jgi:hypothetical protein
MTLLDLLRRLLAPKGDPVFYRALSFSGKPIGMGLSCPHCGFQMRHSLQPGQRVRCSCRWWSAPLFPQLLPVVRLNGRPSTILFDPFWDEPVTRKGQDDAGHGINTIGYI